MNQEQQQAIASALTEMLEMQNLVHEQLSAVAEVVGQLCIRHGELDLFDQVLTALRKSTELAQLRADLMGWEQGRRE